MTAYRICKRCIVDTSDPKITFDDEGICHHCSNLLSSRQKLGTLGERSKRLETLIQEIKKHGSNRRYDCIIGVSGGVDSTFVALRCKDLGLRPLAVHFDNGWNTELSVQNIENTVKRLDIDLETIVVDWEQFRNLQVAFLRASTPDTEAPTDHGLRAVLYNAALVEGVRYVVVGVNLFTEGILPSSWGYGNGDWYYIKHIHKRFGVGSLSQYPRYSLRKLAYISLIKGIRRVNILNYLSYNKREAINEMVKRLDYRVYAGKHHESIFTRFYQGYILPTKFGYDKRRAHLSVLIISGELSREEALRQMRELPYPEDLMREDAEYVRKKLELGEKEWAEIMSAPKRESRDYKSNKWLVERLMPIYHRTRPLI